MSSVRTLPWERQDRIADVKRDLWRHLSPSSVFEDVLLDAGALFQLHPTEAVQLARMHFVLSEEVSQLLDALPLLVGRLSTTTADEEEWSAQRIRGPILWAKVFAARAGSGNDAMYVTAPTFRVLQTPENQLLAFVLERVIELGHRRDWQDSRGALAMEIQSRVASAQRFLKQRPLIEVTAKEPTPRTLQSIATGRHRRPYGSAIAAYATYRRLVAEADRKAIREAVERCALAPADDGTLFEVLTTFRVLDALARLGWHQTSRLGLFSGGLRAQFSGGSRVLDLWYQVVPGELGRSSRYAAVQHAHGLPRSRLRPDLVIKIDRSRWILIECKMGHFGAPGGRSAVDSVREALRDLLGYRRDLGIELQLDVRYGIAVAWGAEMEPVYAEVLLCTIDTLEKALVLALAAARTGSIGSTLGGIGGRDRGLMTPESWW